ncbi:MAG: ATP-binding protein, partial [Candidatus Hydrogenedentes bacterium]|nr:ATP-binding protein [Candidatus Hydrogenedentota bacterium]
MPTDFIDHCVLPESLTSQYVFGEGGPFLTRIGKVNIFVGPNNAGKSRFLRALFAKDLRGLPETVQQSEKET